jgi:hypothetical protein
MKTRANDGPGHRRVPATARQCFLTAVVVFVAAALGASGAGQFKNAAGVFSPDKGKLKILLDGQPVGNEEFEIAPSGDLWTAKGATEVHVPEAGRMRVNATLELRADGTPKSYVWTSQGEKKNSSHVIFEGGTAKITLEIEGARPFQQDVIFGTPLVAVLDNNLYHHYQVLTCVYNWEKKGPQTFPVLIPQDMTPGSITVEATGPQTMNGRSYEGMRVASPDLEVLLYLDAGHRLMRLEVPASKVVVERE